MVLTKTIDNRWIRRYKFFFIVGVVILVCQILLAVRFFALNNDSSSSTNLWTPHRISQLRRDSENSVNSVRHARDGVNDDEDASNTYLQKSVTSRTPKNNKLNQTRLRLEELDFVPPCEISTREAVSAIHRAKTQKCKQEIANITCLIKKGLLYPQKLPNYCPNNDFIEEKSLGCFKDEKNYRLLSGYYGTNKNLNSPDYCIRLCIQSGFPYAGVQYSTECFCGNDEPPSTARLPDSSCNMKCPADPHLACGGYFTINIYQTGISKFLPQIAATESAPFIKPVKIVFLLTINGRAVRQVRRLIKILYHKDHYYYIHIDIRQDYLFRELLTLEKQHPNIRLTRQRFATIWGGASLLQMLLSTMRELLKTDWKWDFVLNLSESDYPVKTVSKLTDFLSSNKHKNFVKSHGREVQRFIQKQGLDKTFVECDNHMWRTGDRALPWGIQIDGGSDWVALSRKFVEYVAVDTPDELVKGLLVVFKHTLLPAESFFHTAIRNSKFCNTYVDNNLHVTNWKRKLGCKCQYKHVVDWCGCSPNDFKPEDWSRIQNTETRQLFFARKFEPIVNQAVILQLEQWLYGVHVTKNIPNLNSYWHNVYSHLDLSLADDSLLTIAKSAARVSCRRHLGDYNISSVKVLDITSHHENDVYIQSLIHYAVNIEKLGVAHFEVGIKPKNTSRTLVSSLLSQRLKYLAVSSDFDQKEQIFRNFAQMLGPYSEPTLVYHFSSSPFSSAITYNVSLLWIDPTGHLAEVSHIVIDENSVIAHVKPNLKQPHLPGLWTVKMLHKNVVFVKVQFLITPLQYFSNTVVTQTQVGFIHAGPSGYEVFGSIYDTFLPSSSERESLRHLSVSNSKRFGVDLEEWIDTLFGSFYEFVNICVVNEISKLQSSFKICSQTNWSSFAPDPKSFIGEINKSTGKFDPW